MSFKRTKAAKIRSTTTYPPACAATASAGIGRVKDLRELLLLGLIATGEIKRKTATGKKISELKKKRVKVNIKRRNKDQ